MLVFFGYTDCPDDCPLTLQKIAIALNAWGELADRIAPRFITGIPPATHRTGSPAISPISAHASSD